MKKIIIFFVEIFRRLFYGRIVIKEIQGIKYELDLSENIDSHLYFRGYWEKNTTKILEDILEPNFFVFEVGSNIGAHTFQIAKKLTHGKVYAFEPTQYAFTKLSRNYSLNKFDNIDLNNIALSNHERSERINRNTDSSSLPFKASWDLKGKKRNPSEENIIFETLDNFVLKRKVKRIDLIKIDTDGSDLECLKGCSNIIKSSHPIVVIEINNNMRLVIDYLKQLQYKFFYNQFLKNFRVNELENYEIPNLIATYQELR